MTLEELTKALGFEGEESKDKVEILKKEFNAKSKEVNTLTKKIAKMEEDSNVLKASADKFDIVVKAYGLDTSAEDFDKMLDDTKDKLIKEAGGGTAPEEVKILKRDLTKSQRELEQAKASVEELTAKLNDEKTQRLNSVKRTEIQKALVANKVLKPDMMIDLFFNKVAIDEDGVTLTMKDEAGNEISVNDGIADWAKANPELVKAETKGGLGSNGSGKFGASGNGDEVSDVMKSIIANRNSGSGNAEGKSLGELFG